MTNTQFGTLIGLFIGAVWAFAGLDGAVVTALLAGLGALIAAIVTGRLDLTEYLGHDTGDHARRGPQ